MEAIGRLAGGVAHDFNNLLTVIGGFVVVVLSSLPSDDPNHGSLRLVREAAEKPASLTSQLLAFSLKQIVQPKMLNLNEAVCGSEKMLRRLIGEDIDVTSTLRRITHRIKSGRAATLPPPGDEGAFHERRHR